VVVQRLDGQRPEPAELSDAGKCARPIRIGNVKAKASCVARRHGDSKLLVVVAGY